VIAARPKVVFIPGIMGSTLRDGTVSACPAPDPEFRSLFTGVSGMALRAAVCRGGDAQVIWGTKALPWLFARRAWKVKLLQGDGWRQPGPVRPAELFGIRNVIAALNPYRPIIRDLEARTDLLIFVYDWRLSNLVNAERLRQEIRARWWREGLPLSVRPEQGVTVIGHSMGGLIARACIEGLEGHRYIKRLVTVGTPHGGSPEAYTTLVGKTAPFSKNVSMGAMLSINPLLRPIATRMPSRLVGTIMPLAMQRELMMSYASAFQLLPTISPVERGTRIVPIDVAYGRFRHTPTGRSGFDAFRELRNVLRHQRDVDRWIGGHNVRYHTIAGEGESTVMRYREGPNTVIRGNDGDGTVPRLSGLLPRGMNITSRTVRGKEHQQLFHLAQVRADCLAFALTGRPAPEAALTPEAGYAAESWEAIGAM
jgi:pimeloyl-ACP methyl ester carboxylesterase